MRFGEDVHDCIRDLLLLNNKNKKLAAVRKAQIELKKKFDEIDKCRHCNEGEPVYCEKCYQELITKNMELQMENIQLCNDINSRGYWPANPLKKYDNPTVITNDFYNKNSQFNKQCNEIKEVLKDGDNE